MLNLLKCVQFVMIYIFDFLCTAVLPDSAWLPCITVNLLTNHTSHLVETNSSKCTSQRPREEHAEQNLWRHIYNAQMYIFFQNLRLILHRICGLLDVYCPHCSLYLNNMVCTMIPVGKKMFGVFFCLKIDQVNIMKRHFQKILFFLVVFRVRCHMATPYHNGK